MTIEDWRPPRDAAREPTFRAELPPRRVPSTADDARATARADARSTGQGSSVTILTFHDFVRTRVDWPFFLGIDDRAAVCVRLSQKLTPDLDGVARGLDAQGPTLLFAAYRGGGYPLLRTVLLLPAHGPYPLEFEAPLVLSQGDVQDFCIALLDTGMVELHVSHTTDRRMLSVGFSAPEGREVLLRVIRQIMGAPYPADETGVPQAIDQMGADFPEFTSGLTRRDAVSLKDARPVDSTAKIEISFL